MEVPDEKIDLPCQRPSSSLPGAPGAHARHADRWLHGQAVHLRVHRLPLRPHVLLRQHRHVHLRLSLSR